MLRIRDRHERDLLYGPTNEEMITDLLGQAVTSYRALPQILYHIQWKFRDEMRPRFGVMRGREFLMKDAYSFDCRLRRRGRQLPADDAGLPAHLPAARRAGDPDGGRHRADRRRPQPRVHRAGADRREPACSTTRPWASRTGSRSRSTCPTRRRWAPSSSGSPRSTPPPTRSTTWPPGTACRRSGGARAAASRSGTSSTSAPSTPGRWASRSRAPTAPVLPRDGQLRHRRVAPGRRHHRGQPRRGRHRLAGRRGAVRAAILNLKVGDASCDALCERLYAAAPGRLLYDDRDDRAGAKFADADLMGHPWQIVVGPRGAAAGRVELKRRATGERVRPLVRRCAGARLGR